MTAGICIGLLLPDLVNVGGVAPIILHHVKSGDTQTISGGGAGRRRRTPRHVRDPKTGNMARDLRQCVTPAAMDSWLLALDKYGTMSLAEILADPIDLCENGYVMYDLLATAVAGKAAKFREWPGSSKVFMRDGQPLGVGDLVVNKDLANMFRRLIAAYDGAATQSRSAGYKAARDLFYKGEIAQEMATFMAENGGLMTYDDIANAAVRLEAPIKVKYRDYEIYAAGRGRRGRRCRSR